MRKKLLLLSIALTSPFGFIGCSSTHIGDSAAIVSQSTILRANSPSSQIENPGFWQSSPQTIWGSLQQIPLHKLNTMQASANPVQNGWVSLAIISKHFSVSVPQLTQQLMVWRGLYPEHPGNSLFPDNSTLTNLSRTPAPRNIAVLMPLTGRYASLGSQARNGFMNAYFRQSANTPVEQTITFYDTNKNPDMVSLYQEATSKGATMVIGPLTKEDVRTLTAKGNFNIPTLALNYTDINARSLPTNFYQFGLSPIDEAQQVADKAYESGHRQALLIAPQNTWGQNLAQSVTARWTANGGKIADSYFFNDKANLAADIPSLLHINPKDDHAKTRAANNSNDVLAEQGRRDYDVIFLLTPAVNARQIVPLLRFYYVDKTPIYSTSAVYTGAPNPQKDTDLNGVIFCDTPGTLIHGSGASNRLSAVGHDAYHISHDLQRFTVLSNFPLYGATGAIHLSANNQFYRRLAWAQFHDGQP